MKEDFKIGDVVIVTRIDFTDEEWLGIGRVHINFNIGDEFEISQLTTDKKGLKCKDLSGNYFYLSIGFELKSECNQKINEKGMQELMLDVLNKTYNNPILRRTTVPLFMSNPGIGKTNVTEKFIKDFIEIKGNKMVTMVLPNLMPNECVGGVFPNQTTRVWEFFDSEKLASLNDGDCLFLDEVFNGTLKQTLDAMLNVLGQRRLGSGKQMADVMIVAASNPQGLINLTPQIKERFIKYDLKFNKEEYQEYLKDKYGIPESISNNLCILIGKEKFESNEWNFVTPRSVEKAINQIGCDLESPYDDLLLPILTAPVKATCDLPSINIKAGETFDYLPILKQLIKHKNEHTKNNLKANRVTSDLFN